MENFTHFPLGIHFFPWNTLNKIPDKTCFCGTVVKIPTVAFPHTKVVRGKAPAGKRKTYKGFLEGKAR